MATPEFIFKSAAYGLDTFTVVDFRGTEAISSLYQFDIGLKCPMGTVVDVETLLNAAATLTLQQGAVANAYSGMLAWVEQQQHAGGFNYYRALLVPPAWRLSLNTSTAGFVSQTHPAIAEIVLANAGLSAGGPELDVTGVIADYPEYDFTCQYAETDLNFVCRLLEYEGVYFYFEESGGVCKMVLADGASYPTQPTVPTLPFTDPSSTNNYDSIVQISRHLAVAPNEVTIAGYNYQTTTVEVLGSSAVTVDGVTSTYPTTAWLYDNRVQTPEAATRLAAVRAQELGCWACTYSGSSAVSGLRAGFTFDLQDHPVSAFNQDYLVTAVQHTARNLDRSWGTGSYNHAQTVANVAYYSNTFTAVPASVQFRPQQFAMKPRISGVLSAAVYLQPDTSSSGTNSNQSQGQNQGQSGQPTQVNPVPGYQNSNNNGDQNAYVLPAPPMDEQGRYLVTLPFANGAVADSSAVSAWIRMAQPSAGLWTGVQHTLEPGAEVLLVFVNGDPDLPVIAGAVYNGGIPAPLTSTNVDPQI